MEIVDANIILRYLLNDVPELTKAATNILKNNKIFVPNEVIAEVTYVLEKLYKVERKEIQDVLCEFIRNDNIIISDKEIIYEAFKIYTKIKIDFVDSILYAYKKCRNITVYTFDKKLLKILNKLDN